MDMAAKLAESDASSEFDEEEEAREVQNDDWDDWESSNADEELGSGGLLCLFCDARFDSAETLFHHCGSDHSFDFEGIRRDLELDFYGSLKLINYVRSQVADNKCWRCGGSFQCKQLPCSHVYGEGNFAKGGSFPWEDDSYLKAFLVDDALLHNLAFDQFDEDDEGFDAPADAPANRDDLIRELMGSGEFANSFMDGTGNSRGVTCCASSAGQDASCVNGLEEDHKDASPKRKDKQLKLSFASATAREIKKVNEDYFGAYGTFGIHREMLSDKVRTDAYRNAILNNPSLMTGATVMDVGCGTGILSLFASQAGASMVIAVEASEKMASIATRIVKDNNFLCEKSEYNEGKKPSGVTIVNCMVEDLERSLEIPTNSIDVLVSEWMGYCLLYESMLRSVLYARDHWLKPGGAILPDTATIYVAGFGKGGTSLPFWENVYGFDMSCIGKEVVEDAAQAPIVDVIDSADIITESVVLQAFDLTTMKPDEMDFTSIAELKSKTNPCGGLPSTDSGVNWCFGVVLWFETDFTSRFCKEMPVTLSTSPYSQRTHWSQSIFTFREPIAIASMGSPSSINMEGASVGTEECPAARLVCRVSVARAAAHRSIDISLEVTGISCDGRKMSRPVQMFNL